MDRRIIFFFIVFVISILLELYAYFAIRSLFQSPRSKQIYSWIFLVQSIFLIFCSYKLFRGMASGSIVRDAQTNFYIGILLSSFVGKLILALGMLMQDGGRFLIGGFNYFKSLFINETTNSFIPSRRNAVTSVALIAASVPFASMLYGITKGKYRYTVERVKLAFTNLPSAFDGLKIVQISDIHSGSFDSKEEVAKGIALINDQNPDLILFTGDLVNSKKDEINPYIEIFAQLKAKYGKYAILGNHDYYGLYDVPEDEKEAYLEDFFCKYEKMGFKLLKNENHMIEKDGQTITILGVENWGKGRYFQKYGDIDKALQGVSKDEFVLMMSHDPSHWSEKIIEHQRHIPITMSGHTHGMQFGINIPGFKWSPVQYRYKHWNGLYEDKGQYLYVNRGFGFLGFPGRVGMWPEITLLELSTVS